MGRPMKDREQHIAEIIDRNPKALEQGWVFGEIFRLEGFHHTYVQMTCGCGHTWSPQLNNLKNGGGCRYCSGKAKTRETHIAEIIERNPKALEQGWVFGEIFRLEGNHHAHIQVTCDCGHEWQPTVNALKNGSGCMHCR